MHQISRKLPKTEQETSSFCSATSHLHHTSRVHTNHHANPTEGRVFLLIVSDVAQRCAPAGHIRSVTEESEHAAFIKIIVIRTDY